MNDMRLTDAQLAVGLRAIVPSEAQVGLHARILAEVGATHQERPLPTLLGRLTDADPDARRRALLLLAAAALLAIGVAAAGVVGALLNERQKPFLSLDPPKDLAGFVRSTYDLMPQSRPVTITTLQDGKTKGKIYVDSSGATRIETFATPDATEPDSYKIFAGTTLGQLTTTGSRRVWSQQTDAISEDPRVFVFATMGAERRLGQPGCEVAISEGEVYHDTPGRAWTYVGVEYVAGRPTHHVSCSGDDLWIDIETRMTLRSRTAVLGVDGRPIPGLFHTIEATQVEFGQPPAALFEMRKPDGAVVAGEAESACASDPYCSASPRPVVTPPPGPNGLNPPADLDKLVKAAMLADKDLPAYEVVVENWSAKYPGSQIRVQYDGSGRYRTELTLEGSPDPPSIVLVGDGHRYASQLTTDGFVYWRDMSGSERRIGYPLLLPNECAGGWQFVGVDLVHGRLADHLACPGPIVPDGYWIDRDTHLVLRTQSLHDEQSGAQVQEVVDLTFGEQPAARFELPPGADVRP